MLVTAWYPTLPWHIRPTQGLGPEAQANCPAFISVPERVYDSSRLRFVSKSKCQGLPQPQGFWILGPKIHGQWGAPHFTLGSCKIILRALIRCLRPILSLKSQGTVPPTSPSFLPFGRGPAQSEGQVFLAQAGHCSASSLQLPCCFVQGLLLTLGEWLDRGPAARALDWDPGDLGQTLTLCDLVCELPKPKFP